MAAATAAMETTASTPPTIPRRRRRTPPPTSSRANRRRHKGKTSFGEEATSLLPSELQFECHSYHHHLISLTFFAVNLRGEDTVYSCAAFRLRLAEVNQSQKCVLYHHYHRCVQCYLLRCQQSFNLFLLPKPLSSRAVRRRRRSHT